MVRLTKLSYFHKYVIQSSTFASSKTDPMSNLCYPYFKSKQLFNKSYSNILTAGSFFNLKIGRSVPSNANRKKGLVTQKRKETANETAKLNDCKTACTFGINLDKLYM